MASISAANASELVGSARRATCPQASSSEGWEEHTTGMPLAMASMTGIPNPSNLEGYANSGGPAVELGEPVVVDESELADAVHVELRRLAPPASADQGELEVAVRTPYQPERVDERLEVLPRLVRTDR